MSPMASSVNIGLNPIREITVIFCYSPVVEVRAHDWNYHQKNKQLIVGKNQLVHIFQLQSVCVCVYIYESTTKVSYMSVAKK